MKYLQAQFKIIIEWYHNSLIDINQLEKIMLILNPHPEFGPTKTIAWEGYNCWVKGNIAQYKEGESNYILSLTSSGGMYQSFEE